jgi:branched-chain amino acid transport system substrate-binding protein
VTTAAVLATKTLDNTKLADWLHANKVQTVQRLIGWDDLGRPSGSFFLVQRQAGKIHVVAPSGDPNKNAKPQFPKPSW